LLATQKRRTAPHRRTAKHLGFHQRQLRDIEHARKVHGKSHLLLRKSIDGQQNWTIHMENANNSSKGFIFRKFDDSSTMMII
jgi:hypothetical protein